MNGRQREKERERERAIKISKILTLRMEKNKI